MQLVDLCKPGRIILYNLKPHPQYQDVKDFSKFNGRLAIIFEDKSCADCDEFHKEVLMHQDVLTEMQKFTVVRLDALSTKPLIDVDGNKTTAQDWASHLNLDYRPGYCSIQ